jgi:integrase
VPVKHKTARHGIERCVPLNADAMAAIGGGMRLGGGDAFVFVHTRGRPFTANALLLAVRRAIAATGCTNWSPYSLRHLAATTALARTGSEAAAAALLGHTPRSTIIQRYSRDRLALAAKAAKAIEIQEVA